MPQIWINRATGRIALVKGDEKFNPRIYPDDPTRAWSRVGTVYVAEEAEPTEGGGLLVRHRAGKDAGEEVVRYRCKAHADRWEAFIHRSHMQRVGAPGHLQVYERFGCKTAGKIIDLVHALGDWPANWLIAIHIAEEYQQELDRAKDAMSRPGTDRLFRNARHLLDSLATGDFDRIVVLDKVLKGIPENPEEGGDDIDWSR